MSFPPVLNATLLVSVVVSVISSDPETAIVFTVSVVPVSSVVEEATLKD